jgi:integrase
MLRSLTLVMRSAAVIDKDGTAKYTLHDFRHFFASWCISPKERVAVDYRLRWCGNGLVIALSR